MTRLSQTSAWVSEDLASFRSKVRGFIRAEMSPRQARWRRQRGPDADAWTKAGEAGLLLCDIPREYGGHGGTFAHEAVVAEELACEGIAFASFVHSSVAHCILAYAREDQKRAWLPRMARGELVGAVALTESGAGSDVQGIKTTARRDGDRYVVEGSKAFVTNGSHASLVCCAVVPPADAAGPRRVSLLVFETAGLAGYGVGSPVEKVGMHAQDVCELFFDGVRVPASSLLGNEEGRGVAQIMLAMGRERLTIGVTAVAAAEQALRITTRHVKERKAFGKTLFDFQNTRFRLAECHTGVKIARVFLDSCIERFVAGRLDEADLAMAKYWLSDLECHVVDECVQLHGGYGYMVDQPIARMWTDSRVHRIYAGANELMKELIALSL